MPTFWQVLRWGGTLACIALLAFIYLNPPPPNPEPRPERPPVNFRK